MKKISWVLALLVIMSVTASANMIDNAGFETWWSDWASWGNYSYNDTLSYMDNSGNLGGSMAGELRNEGATLWTGFWQDSNEAPVEGETYTASAYLTLEADTVYSEAFVKLEFYNGGTAISSYTNTFAFGTLTPGTWTQYEISGVAPAGATAARINIGVDNITTAGSLYVDGASLIAAVPEPVSAALLGLGMAFLYVLRRKIRN